MQSNNSAQLQSKLIEAYNELGSNRPEAAIEKLQKIIMAWPSSSDAQHLLALSYKKIGLLDRSKKHFHDCLGIQFKQPEVHNNLANLLKSERSFEEAEHHYLQALSMHPSYLEAQRNLAICYQAQSNYDLAIENYRKALKLSSGDVSSINGLADSLRLSGDLLAAHQAYQQALAIDPQRVNSWHNLGLTYHLQGELAQAIDCYRKAYEIAPNSSEVAQSLALALYENGDVASAIELFTQALNINPGDVELHECFNNMLWETEYASQFGDSYVEALNRLNANNRASESAEVALSYVSLLYQAGQVEQASAVINSGALSASNTYEVLSLRGQIEAELGDYDSAYRTLSSSLASQYTKDVARQMTKIDIILERYQQAQKLLELMFSKSPNCQLTWALQGLVWRLTGDQRYHWLCDYKSFVQSYLIEAPKRYESLEHFLEAVREVLHSMHRNERAPLQQTLRNGTQTAARLLHAPNPILQELKECLTGIVAQYINGLPSDSDHPLLSRKTQQFEFSGSWSVKLHANGFHINHVHPDGWISSSCYITIPSSMSQNEEQEKLNQGHIKFGESPLQLGSRECVELSLEPTPGMVVLFPSYFWHGTVPFDGGPSDHRLTAPFDVVPG